MASRASAAAGVAAPWRGGRHGVSRGLSATARRSMAGQRQRQRQKRLSESAVQAASSSAKTPVAQVAVQAASSSAKTPLCVPLPADALPEIFVPNVMPNEGDERLWVPQTDTVSFRPLLFNVAQGYYVNLLRVREAGLLSCHRHTGPVHGFVLKGSWRYLEHKWIASEGSYVFEPPGETHTLVILPGSDEMITMFHVTGGLVYCDPEGNPVGYDDVFSKLEKARAHYKKVGLGEDYVDQFIR